MGRVLEHVKGRDGVVRGAKLKVLAKGGTQTSVYRPLQKLIPFEIVEHKDAMEEEGNAEGTSTEKGETMETELEMEEQSAGRKSPRKAAIEGQALRRLREQYS